MPAEGVRTPSEPSSPSQCFAFFREAPSNPALRLSLILNLSPLDADHDRVVMDFTEHRHR
jgi:hypothetical protein